MPKKRKIKAESEDEQEISKLVSAIRSLKVGSDEAREFFGKEIQGYFKGLDGKSAVEALHKGFQFHWMSHLGQFINGFSS